MKSEDNERIVDMTMVYNSLNAINRLYELTKSQDVSNAISPSFAKRFLEREKPQYKFISVEEFFYRGLETAADLFHQHDFEKDEALPYYDVILPFFEASACFDSMASIATMFGFDKEYSHVLKEFKCTRSETYRSLSKKLLDYFRKCEDTYSIEPNGNVFLLDKSDYVLFRGSGDAK